MVDYGKHIIANHIFDVVDHAVNGLEGKNVNMIRSPFLVGMVVDITLHATRMFYIVHLANIIQ